METSRLWTAAIVFFASVQLHAEMKSYSLCPGFQSLYFTDSVKSRGLVINYNAAQKRYVFLRCGDSDTLKPSFWKTQQLPCHVIRDATEEQLCQHEGKVSRVSRVIGDVIDAGVSTVTSGGMSTISKVKRVVNTVRGLTMKPKCLGTSLITAMATGTNSSQKMKAYYDSQVEIGPLAGLTRFSTRKPAAQTNYIYSQLDAMLSPGNRATGADGDRRLKLSGPVYMTALRNRRGTNHLQLDTPNHQQFCQFLSNEPPAKPAPEDEESLDPESTNAVSILLPE